MTLTFLKFLKDKLDFKKSNTFLTKKIYQEGTNAVHKSVSADYLIKFVENCRKNWNSKKVPNNGFLLEDLQGTKKNRFKR